MEDDVRTRVLALFEKHRARPGAPYDDHHFLDFLLAEPKGRHAVRNSFGGLRRFNAFLNDSQYQFGVCFSAKDREANYPLDKFVTRIAELQRSPRGSLKSLENQTNVGPGWQVLVFADLGLLVAGAFVRDSVVGLAIVVTLALTVNASFLLFAWRSKRYLLKLRRRIEFGSAESVLPGMR